MNENFVLSSPAFANNGTIPAKYTCDGDHLLSPPLSISGIPEGTKSLALIMEDPDIPKFVKESRGIETFDHWVLYNLPVNGQALYIEEGKIPEGTMEGLNSAGETGYTSPCPPPQYEPREHRYIFSLYALSGMLTFPKTPTKQQIRDAMAPIVLAETKFIGRYSRK